MIFILGFFCCYGLNGQASISGSVWHDLNGNGQHGSEPYLNGFTVELYNVSNVLQAVAATSGSGSYSFNSLAEGIYYVKFIPLPTYVVTPSGFGSSINDCDVTGANGEGTTDDIILQAVTNINNIDAGYFRPPIIGNMCWRDQNTNGLQDGGEFVFPNVEVWLYRSSDNLEMAYTVTDANGQYIFGPDPAIKPGEYYIKFGIPNTFLITIQNAGDDAIDSDVNPSTGETIDIFFESGDENFSIDAGFYFEPPVDCDSSTANECVEAEVLCELSELNGFCTSMVQAWQQTTIPGCGSGYAFHNPSWFSFVAGAEDVYLIIHASNCVSGGGNIGIQWGIYDDCDLQGPVILQCPCVDPGDIDVFLNNLTVGQAYYFFIDGCSGTMCTYWIEFIYGGGLPDVLGPDNVVCNEFQNCENICTGADVTFILQDVYNATHYIWNIDGNIIKTTYPELTTSFDGAGNYNICVNGYNACNEGNEFCFNVSVNPRPSVNISSTPASGNNINDGTATANPEGGIAPYTYLWSNGQTTQTITGLAPGTYSVTVTDANQCTDLGYIIINSEGCGALSLNIFTIDESCSGYCNGALAITGINNGTSPFTYSWSNGSNTPLINNLCSGTYTVTVTDAESCTVTDTVIIVPEVEIIITVDTIVNITSNGYGAIILSVNEGDYSYSWTGPENFTSDDFIILNLKLAGCYTLVITENESGCTKDSTICISDLTGTKNLSGDAKVIIYPNPANDYLVVDFSATEYGEANIWISDLSGRKIISAKKSATDNKLHLNTGYINAGLYFMRIEMKDNAFYRKVEIVR